MDVKINKKVKANRKKGYTPVNNFQLLTLCMIPMLLLFVFNYLPIGGIIIAFKNYRFDKGIFGSEWVGMENFSFFVHSDDFLKITWNTIYLNLLMIVFGMIAAVLLAVVLYDISSRNATKIYQTILITPNFLSWVVVGYIAYAFFNPSYGLINSFLNCMGIESVDIYSEPKAWPAILIAFSVWKNVGMDSVIYYSALMGIDSEIFEAAEIDGASRRHIVWYIMIPSLMPILTVMFILKIGSIFRADFGLFYQLTRDIGTLYSTTDVIDTYIFRTMRVIGDMGVSAAVGLMQSVVGFVMVVATNAIVKKIDPERGLF